MENFKNHIKPFEMFKKQTEKDPNEPKYIKPDGTKIIEKESPLGGKAVYEIAPDGVVICRTYNKSDKLILDYIRKLNLEIGHTYDEFQKVIYEFNAVYDENNKLARNKEIGYEYYDNGIKSKETIILTPGNLKSELHYDEQGQYSGKIEYRGSVTTWFDKNDKPYKREIDRGSGGIITENL